MTDISQPMSHAYRARFDECGPDGCVRSSALLRYAVDLAWIHSERSGFTREWYAERAVAWVVRSAELAVVAPVPLGRVVTLGTAVTGFRRVWSRRRTEGHLDDGTLALWSHTDWVMTDTVRGLPGRVPPEFPARFAAPLGSFEPVRVALPETPANAHRATTRVRPQDLDPNDHVNNAAYVDYLEEALIAAGGDAALATRAIPRHIRLEYAVPALPGAVLGHAVWPIAADPMRSLGPGWAWRLADAEGRDLARATVTFEQPPE